LVGWVRKKYKRLQSKKHPRVLATDHREISPNVHTL
jgi:hypothetical protein